MGLENRDYVRGNGGGDYIGGRGGSPVYSGHRGYSATAWLIGITVAVFVLQLLITHNKTTVTDSDVARQRARYEKLVESLPPSQRVPPEELDANLRSELEKGLRANPVRVSVVEEWCALTPVESTQGFQVWRFVTYAFLHSRGGNFPTHLVFNMLALFFFGPAIEMLVGKREFIVFYLLAAVAAGAAFIGYGYAFNPYASVIGASGSVMAVLMVYAWHYPRNQVYIWGVLPVQVRWLVVAYVVYDMWPVVKVIMGGADNSGVAHVAHLAGLLFGYQYAKEHWRVSDWLAGLRRPQFGRKSRGTANENLRVYEPPENLREQVDAILEKISRQGEASLTDAERDTLKRASQQFRNR